MPAAPSRPKSDPVSGFPRALGQSAEDAAVDFLVRNGYRLLHRNFSTRSGELDIVAADGDTICFVEVKARTGTQSGPPYEAVGFRKQSRIRSAAGAWLAVRHMPNVLARFDVVSLTPDPAQESGWKIELLRDAF